MELFKEAYLGINQYFIDNKIIALVFAILVCYLFFSKEMKGAEKNLIVYAALAFAMIVFPITAVILMFYQTRFHEYQQIFSLVPVTALVALGITKIYWKETNHRKDDKYLKVYKVIGVFAIFSILFLSGYKNQETQNTITSEQKKQVTQMIEFLSNNEKNGRIWGPSEIMEEFRRQSGEFSTFYGKNMWEEEASIYFYEAHSIDKINQYIWMKEICEKKVYLSGSGVDKLKDNIGKGVRVIILPRPFEKDFEQDLEIALEYFSTSLTFEKMYTQDYVLWRLFS